MRISKYMTDKLITAGAHEGAREVFFRMREYGIRHMLVVDASRTLIGIVSDRDLRRPGWVDQARDLSHEYTLTDDLRLGDLMTTNVVTVRTYDPVTKAARLMREHHFGCLPVLDKTGALVGVVSPLDLLVALEELSPALELKAG